MNLDRRRAHLLAELDRPPGHTHRTLLAGAVVVLVAAATLAGLSALGGKQGHGPAAAAFEVTRRPTGTVTIRIVDSAVDAADMTRQLHDQGLDVTVDTVPANPGLVGHWFSFGTQDQALEASLEAQIRAQTSSIELPVSFSGSVGLTMGRATGKGERAAVIGFPNVLAPGAPFSCLRLQGADATAAAAGFAPTGLTPLLVDHLDPYRPVAHTGPLTGLKIVRAFVVDYDPGTERVIEHPTTVQVLVGDPTSPGYDALRHLGWPASVDIDDPDYSGCG